MRKMLLGLLILLCLPLPTLAQVEDITLIPFESDTFGISGMIPDGWQEASPGIYVRGSSETDVTTLIIQAAPGTTDSLKPLLAQQLGISDFPTTSTEQVSPALTWAIYSVPEAQIPLGAASAEIALAQVEGTAFLVVLVAAPEDMPDLHEAVFTPVVNSIAPAGSDTPPETYVDPTGLFSVPIPTNWTAEQGEGYGVLHAPEDEIMVYVLVLDGDETAAAAEQAWQMVDPAFDLEVIDTFENPASGDSPPLSVFSYDGGEEEIIQALAIPYESKVYLQLYRGEPAAFERRQSQVSVIASGFDILSIVATNLSGTEPLVLDDTIIPEFEAYIQDTLTALEVPGAAVAVVQNGEIVYAQGFGMKNDTEPMTPETLMMIGSTSKTMTTLLMAQLVDAGLMAWDTPVIEIVPEFAVSDPELTQQITMQNLVCACSGVPRQDLEIVMNYDHLTPRDTIEALKTFQFFTDFGEAFQYSNQMVAMGGYAATVASGGNLDNLNEAYSKALESNIFAPLNMPNTTLSFEEATAGNYAEPYGTNLLNEFVPGSLDYEHFIDSVLPAGGVWSNVLDMSNYLIMELNAGTAPDGTRIVSEENLRRTWEPQVAIDATSSYGLGWMIGEYKGLQVIEHNGNMFGYTSDLAFLPEANLGIVVLTNARGSNLFNTAVRFRLIELLFEQPAEYEQTLQTALAQFDEIMGEQLDDISEEVDPAAVADYLGTFTHPALGELTLSLDETTLTADAGEFVTMLVEFTDDDGKVSYVFYDPPLTGISFEMTTDDAGAPILKMGSAATEYIFTKVE